MVSPQGHEGTKILWTSNALYWSSEFLQSAVMSQKQKSFFMFFLSMNLTKPKEFQFEPMFRRARGWCLLIWLFDGVDRLMVCGN